MGVLVEGWVPVGVFADINLKMEFTSATAVRLVHVDASGPAYVPVYNVNNPAEVRMAMIPVNGLPISTAGVGPGGLDVAGPLPDTGFDVYILVKDDLSICAAIACMHTDGLGMPAGWGHVYASRAIRYFCCNVTDGEQPAVHDGILPFVEVAPRKTFYCGEGENVLFFNETAVNHPATVIPLATSAEARKAQFPATARKAFVQLNINSDDANSIGIYLDGGTSPVYRLTAGHVNDGGSPQEPLVIVPCQGNMDTTALMYDATGGGDATMRGTAIGYQL